MKLTVYMGRLTSKPGIRANRLLRAVQPENRAASLPRGQESLVHFGETCLARFSPSNLAGNERNGVCIFSQVLPLLGVDGHVIHDPSLAFLLPSVVWQLKPIMPPVLFPAWIGAVS